MRDRSRVALRILFGFVMLLFGALMANISRENPTAFGTLLQNFGFAFIVAGVIFVFQEAVIARLRGDEARKNLDDLNEKIDLSFKNLEESYGTTALGIRMLTAVRRGYPGYHKWLLHRDPQELFFAGNSVLHRVQADFNYLGLPRVEEALFKKLAQGCRIRIIYLDPTWDFIKQIAEDGDQNISSLMTDLAETLGICKRTWEALNNKTLAGRIEIRVCRGIQQYAFHYVLDMKSNKVEMLVGLYFAGRLGTHSPLFSVENSLIQETYLEHFNTLFNRSTSLMEYSPPGVLQFNENLYYDCRVVFLKYVRDDDLINKLCPS